MTAPFPSDPYLSGNYAPVRYEAVADDLVVVGDLPRSLNGSLYRNTPNPKFAPRMPYHWFLGDGMVHALHIADGKADYRNRWVRTPGLKAEIEAGKALFGQTFGAYVPSDPSVAGKRKNPSNTTVVWHGQRLFAIDEGSPPMELDPVTLETKGTWLADGKIRSAVTAHPKIDAVTGEMFTYGYDPLSTKVVYYVMNALGVVTHTEEFSAPYASMLHDFVIAGDYAVFPIFPASISVERAQRGGAPIAWDAELATHWGIMPRKGPASAMRWFKGEACYAYHFTNAFTSGSKVIVEGLKYPRLPLFGTSIDPKDRLSLDDGGQLVRWTFDLAGNTSDYTEEVLADERGEFPRTDERRVGLEHRHTYWAAVGQGAPDPRGTFKYVMHRDNQSGRLEKHYVGDHSFLSEPVFVPRTPESAEGDGHLLAPVYHADQNRSDVLVYEASNVAAGPVATIQLETRIPYGFHGTWRDSNKF